MPLKIRWHAVDQLQQLRIARILCANFEELDDDSEAIRIEVQIQAILSSRNGLLEFSTEHDVQIAIVELAHDGFLHVEVPPRAAGTPRSPSPLRAGTTQWCPLCTRQGRPRSRRARPRSGSTWTEFARARFPRR